MAVNDDETGPTIRTLLREWRQRRPFWGGLCTIGSGLIIIFPPYASLRFGDMVVSLNTLGGMSALMIGLVLVLSGITMWTQPNLRVSAGVVTLILAVLSVVCANLGSFLIGTILGVLGSGLAIAWTPAHEASETAETPAEASPPATRQAMPEDFEQHKHEWSA